MIGSILFVYGGVLLEYVKYGLDTFNEEIL